MPFFKNNDMKEEVHFDLDEEIVPYLYHEFEYDSFQETARLSFADILHDVERNQKYYDALKMAIDKLHFMGKKAKVLDIGTGTGFLSMMAAKCGADSVVACEAVELVGNCVKDIIKLNELEEIIKVICKNSTELTIGEKGDLLEKPNILVTDVFDTALIGKGALDIFAHAHENLLEDNCIVIPSFAIIYAQIVECPLAQNLNAINDVCDEDGKILVQSPDCMKNCRGSAAVHDIQLSQLSTEFFKEIIKPEAVIKFDWSKKNSYNFTGQNILKVKAERTGMAYVVFMWWELAMDPENKINLSCAPYWAHPMKQTKPTLTVSDLPWRDHWKQALYYLPYAMNVQKDQDLVLVASHDAYSLWFHLDSSPMIEIYNKPFCNCDLHIYYSRIIIGLLNDKSKQRKYLSVMKKYINGESTVLLMSDGFYLGLSAVKLGAKRVLCLVNNDFSKELLEKFKKFNRLNNVEIIESLESLKMNVHIKDVTLVLGLPYFVTSTWPWDNILFSYLLKKMRSDLPQSVVIAPRTVSIKGIVVEFKDLQKIALPVEVWEEFDLKPFDDLILMCHTNIEAQPLWEYACVARSSIMEIAQLNIESMGEKDFDAQYMFPLPGNPTCNAVVFWTEWDLDGTCENIISTGPIVPPVLDETIQWDMHTKQGVHFCLNSNAIKQMYISFYFCAKEGKVRFVLC